MTYSQKIKMALAYINMSESELARRLNTSPQAFHQRMKTDKFTADELNRIADVIGASFDFGFVFPNGDRI